MGECTVALDHNARQVGVMCEGFGHIVGAGLAQPLLEDSWRQQEGRDRDRAFLAELTPGTISTLIPASRHAWTSSARRPKTNEPPPLSRTTDFRARMHRSEGVRVPERDDPER